MGDFPKSGHIILCRYIVTVVHISPLRYQQANSQRRWVTHLMIFNHTPGIVPGLGHALLLIYKLLVLLRSLVSTLEQSCIDILFRIIIK